MMSDAGSLTKPQDEAAVNYGFDTPEIKELPEQEAGRDFENAVQQDGVVLNLNDYVLDADSRGQAVGQRGSQLTGKAEPEKPGEPERPNVVELPAPPPAGPTAGVQIEAAAKEEQVEKFGGKPLQRAAGLLPLDIQLQTQGVEYVFRDLRAGEHIEMAFRRVESQNWWDLLKVLCAALLFFLVIRDQNLIRRSVWAAFILSAAPFVLGDEWASFCNQLLVGVLLGIGLALVVRFRNRLIPKAGQVASLLFLVMVSAANADTTTVYIPYDEKHPESVTAETKYWLPYEDFTKLWKAAKANQRKADVKAGPVEYSLDRADYTVSIGEASVTLQAGYRITQASGSWVTIPFPFPRARVVNARVDGQPALLEEHAGGCCLHLKDQGPHLFEAELSYPCKPGSLSGSMAQAIPQISLSTVRVLLPKNQLGASIHPLIGSESVTDKDGKKQVLAAIGKSALLEVKWFPEVSHERPPVPVKASVQIQHNVVGKVENWRAGIDLHFQGEKRSEFLFLPHPSLSITSVQAPNLAGWTWVDRDGGRVLQVQLLEEVADSAHLQLTAERVMDATQREVPLVTLPGVLETTFQVTLLSAPWLDLRVDTGDFRRVETQPQTTPGMHAMGTYDTTSHTGVLRYEVLQRPQEVTWRLDYLFQVSSRKIEETVLANLDIRKHPLFRMSLAIPAGYRCERIEGQDIKDWWQEPSQATGEGHVQVDFRSGLLCASTMIVHLVNLLPEDLDTLSIAPVRFIPESEDSQAKIEGTVVVASHSSVTPHPIEETGLVSTTLCDDKTPPGQCQVGGKLVVSPPLEKKLAYRAQTSNFSAKFSLDRTPLRYGVVWVTLAEAHETWIAYSTHLQLKVLQGSLRAWEFLAPAALGEIEVKGQLVREVSSQVEGESRKYKVQMDSELFSETTLDLSFEVPIQGPASVPHFSFPNAERSNGYLLTANESNYELKVQPKGALERAQRTDIAFLPRETGILDSFKVFRDDWNLELDLAHTVSAETLDALIDWIDLETLIRRDGTSLTKASIRISNKSLQFLSIQLPKGADLLSLDVAGEASGANSTVRDGENILLVPLIKTAPGQLSFVIDVIYERTLSGPLACMNHLAFEGPKILDIPVAQTLWTFYVPEDYEPFWLTGNMEETTETVREYSKLTSLEEERQQLKALVVGDYDLSTRQRAYENYEKASAQVQEQQTILEGRNVQQEIGSNRRLRGKARGIEQELGKVSQKISSSMGQEEELGFKSKVESLQRETSEKKAQEISRGRSLRSEVGGQERSWFSNLFSSPTPSPSAPQAGADYQQISSNAYFFGAPLSVDKKEQTQARQEVSKYLNLSQSEEQQDLYESQVSTSNQAIVNDLNLQGVTSLDGNQIQGGAGVMGGGQPGAMSGMGGMIGGGMMMQGGVMTSPLPQTPSINAPMGEVKPEAAPVQVVPAPVPMPPSQPPAEVHPKATGAYSIPVRFPREGVPVTFRKLHADAKVGFKAIDQKVGEITFKIIVVLVMAVLLWVVMKVFSWPALCEHLKRHWRVYLVIGGLLFLLFIPLLAILVLIVAVLLHFGRIYIRSFTAGPAR